jgi:hypothetical protein
MNEQTPTKNIRVPLGLATDPIDLTISFGSIADFTAA